MEKAKVIRSLIYKFTERFAVKFIGLVIGIILARLLSPEINGQVALLEVVVNFSLLLIEDGVNNALVQTRTAEERDYVTVFFITLGLAGAALCILEYTAPLIAAYYNSPALTAPLRFYALSLLFGAFNSIQVARMQREMRFRELMHCNLAATLLAGTLGIVLAYRGAGLWALVIYHFAQIAIACLAAFLVLRWIPRGRFSMDSARRLGGFGIKMLAASAIQNIYLSLRPLIIGKRFSAADLGCYDKGRNFSYTISVNLDAAIRSVMFPVLSRAQDDREKFTGIMRQMSRLGSFVIFPVMLGLAAVAEPFIRLLLTEKWIAAAPILVILSIGEAQIPLTSANLIALKSLGRSDLYARQELVRRALMLVVLVISVVCFHSVEAIAVGYSVSAWLDVFVTSLPIKKLLNYGVLDQLRDVWKTALSTVLMALAVYALGALPLPTALLLMVQVLCGAAVYLGLNVLLKSESLMYILSLLGRRKAAS